MKLFLSNLSILLLTCGLCFQDASTSSGLFVSGELIKSNNDESRWLRALRPTLGLQSNTKSSQWLRSGRKRGYRFSARMPSLTGVKVNEIDVDDNSIDKSSDTGDNSLQATQRTQELDDAYAAFLKLVAGSMTMDPSTQPSEYPSDQASDSPSMSVSPSDEPSMSSSPSHEPSVSTAPSQEPSMSPAPSDNPTVSFSPTETDAPSNAPSASVQPSHIPSVLPSVVPTELPSVSPSTSVKPSEMPSSGPSTSIGPSTMPTEDPTVFPSGSPTNNPTVSPSEIPTNDPSRSPTLSPTISSRPSISPTSCLLSPEEREEQILEILGNVSDPILLQNFALPQGKATDWILNNDGFGVCPDDAKLIQRWALAVVYYSTLGDDWILCYNGDPNCGETVDGSGNFLVHFLSPADECEWFGITCGNLIDGERCVERIIFEENNLSGTIPTELALLSDLKVLGMEQGTTTGRIPSELGQLEKMIFIDLDFNELTGEIPTEIWQLTDLTTLDLNVNNLNGTLDTRIGNLSNLDFVQLQNNQFTGTIPTEIVGLFNLNTFNVHKNDFSGSIPSEICLNQPNPLSSLIADCKCKGKEGKDNPEKVSCDCCSGCGCKKENN